MEVFEVVIILIIIVCIISIRRIIVRAKKDGAESIERWESMNITSDPGDEDEHIIENER